MRFPIRFDAWYAFVSSALLLRPRDAYVEIGDDEVVVRMAWAFKARFSRSSVASVQRFEGRPASRGVHGLAGRWLVNGSGENVVVLRLRPAQRATVMGFPVRLGELMVSVDDPDALAAALT